MGKLGLCPLRGFEYALLLLLERSSPFLVHGRIVAGVVVTGGLGAVRARGRVVLLRRRHGCDVYSCMVG